jgi:hypothetical protein
MSPPPSRSLKRRATNAVEGFIGVDLKKAGGGSLVRTAARTAERCRLLAFKRRDSAATAGLAAESGSSTIPGGLFPFRGDATTYSPVPRFCNKQKSSGLLIRLGTLDGMARSYPRLYSTKQRTNFPEPGSLEMPCCNGGRFLVRTRAVHDHFDVAWVTFYNRVDVFRVCAESARDDAILRASFSRSYIENDQLLASID